MSGWAIAGIVVASVIVFLGLLYLGIGVFSYFISIRRNGLIGRIVEKQFSKDATKYKIEHSWWEDKEIEKLILNNGKENLAGFLIKQPSKKIAICLHGYFSNHKDIQPQAKIFFDNGFNILAPDLRAHGESEGKTVGMAYLDKSDTILWINKVIEIFGKDCQMVLFGLSMGASTVCMVSGENLPKNVKCIISDCGYESAYTQFKDMLKKVWLPEFPLMRISNRFAKLLGKYSLKDANVISQVAKSKLPILFIHGTADKFVACYMGKNLFSASNKKVCELYLVEGAGHAMSYATNPKVYTERVISFVNKFVR